MYLLNTIAKTNYWKSIGLKPHQHIFLPFWKSESKMNLWDYARVAVNLLEVQRQTEYQLLKTIPISWFRDLIPLILFCHLHFFDSPTFSILVPL